MKKTNYLKSSVLCCYTAMLLFSFGCSKMNDLHDEYLKRGETLYVGKPDSVRVLAGRERVKLLYWVSDPKATKLVVYWKSRTDSVVVNIPTHESPDDTLELIIGGLVENQYSFILHTMNSESRNRSIAAQASGMVYGQQFQNGLLNRLVKEGTLSGTGQLDMVWLGAVEKGVGSEISYRAIDGTNQVSFVPMSHATTMLTGVAGDIKYRTLFLPEATAIDTFYTEWDDYEPAREERLDGPLFQRWNPDGIPYSAYSPAFSIETLWDVDPANRYLFLTTVGQPFSFTFDMGQTALITRFMAFMDPGQLFTGQSVESFELWGTVSPDVNAEFGSGWHKLGDYRFTRPSESGGTAAEDRAVGLLGEEFTVNPGGSPVRYLRFVVKKSWSNSPYVTLSALRFWGQIAP